QPNAPRQIRRLVERARFALALTGEPCGGANARAMSDQNGGIRQRILDGRTAVADLGSAIIEYLATVERVTEAASAASSRYQELVGLADVPLSEELGGKLRESVAQFARGSIAMATTFSQIMRTMQDAYEKLEGQTKDQS